LQRKAGDAPVWSGPAALQSWLQMPSCLEEDYCGHGFAAVRAGSGAQPL